MVEDLGMYELDDGGVFPSFDKDSKTLGDITEITIDGKKHYLLNKSFAKKIISKISVQEKELKRLNLYVNALENQLNGVISKLGKR